MLIAVDNGLSSRCRRRRRLGARWLACLAHTSNTHAPLARVGVGVATHVMSMLMATAAARRSLWCPIIIIIIFIPTSPGNALPTRGRRLATLWSSLSHTCLAWGVAAVWLVGDSCAPFDLLLDTVCVCVADSDIVVAQPPPFPGQHTRVWTGSASCRSSTTASRWLRLRIWLQNILTSFILRDRLFIL